MTESKQERLDVIELKKDIHSSYIKDRKRNQAYVLITQFAILTAFFGLWEIAGRLSWIDILLFSYPSKIVELLYSNIIDASLFPHVFATLAEVVVGFVLGTLIGTLIAAMIWWSPFLARVLDPFIVVLNSMPKVALGPLFIVGLGPGILSIIAMTLAITVVITILVVYNSFKEVDSNYVKVVKVFGGDKKKIFTNVIFPASIPTIVSALKVNVGLAWIGVIVGEFLVSKQGLGYLIIYGFQVFNFTLVLGSLFVICFAAAVMYQGVSYLERRFDQR